jgi:hypothetical protein
MKKVLLGLLATAVVPMLAVAQGTVSFSTSTANHKVVFSSNTTQAAVGFNVALYWGSTGSTEGQLVQLGANTTVAATGFLVAGGVRTTGSATPEGGVGVFQIRAWNGNAATFETALSGIGFTDLGKSALFTNGTGAPNGTPPTTASQLAGWTSPVLVAPVPEPSTLALAGLGAAAMLVLRRRK